MWYIDTIPTNAWVSKWWAVVEKKESKWSNIPLKILNPNRSATSTLISNEEKVEKETKKESLNEWLEKRSNIRKDILSWKISVWDKWADTWAVRKSRLADLARWTLIDLWKNPDNIKKISDDDLIKRLTSDKNWINQNKLDLVNDYIKNWWYAEEVYDELTTNKKVDRKWFRESAGIATAEVPAKTMLNLTDMSNKISSKIVGWISKWLWVSEDKVNLLSNFVVPWLVNPVYTLTQWINQLFWFGSDESYNEAVKNWYDGTKEEFKAQDTITNKARSILPKDDTLNKNWKAVWDFVWEWVEFAVAPEMKLKWLWKFWEKWLWKIIKNAGELWLEWASFQALEDINKWELSDASDYLTSAWMNAWFGSIIRTIMRWVSSLPAKSQAAINSKTEAEWNNMSKITDDYFNMSWNKVTPYSEIINILRAAKDKLSWKRIESWKALEEARKWLEYWEKPYTAREVLTDIWNAFEWLKSSWTWGEQALTPKFNVSKSGRTLKIENKDVLNTITKNDNWVTIKLWDKIEDLWREMFNTTDKKITAQTTDEFIRRVKSLLKDEWWNWTSGEWLKTVRQALETVEENFGKSLTEKSWAAWKSAREQSSKSINIDKDFDDIIWKLETTSWQKKALNLKQYGDPNTEELFRLVREETGIDLNNEVWAWIVNIALKDPKEAEKLISTFYPSSPWATEFVMKNIMRKLQQAWASRYTIDWWSSVAERLAETIPWMATNEMVDIKDVIK